jgi:16S rRNA (uracil1498-N3)-methyltransferase
MARTRLYIDDKLECGAELVVSGDKARYLGKVLRLRVGDQIAVFNGRDGEFDAQLSHIARHDVELVLGEARETRTESDLKIHLVQGISRGERMDLVVQKATELGVKRITPVLTEYGVVKLAAERAAKRQDHWQKIAISACEQSGRTRPPLVEVPLTLKEWFGQRSQRADVELILQPGAANNLSAIEAPQTKVCLMIGPEGGFSQSEYDDAGLCGFRPVSLGPRVLRTETAAITALAIAQSLWGDLQA